MLNFLKSLFAGNQVNVRAHKRKGNVRVKAHQRTVSNGYQTGFLSLGSDIYDPFRPQDYKPQAAQRKTRTDTKRMKAPPTPTRYKRQSPGERWQPTKEQVLKSKLYVASLAQEYADRLTASYQKEERQYWLHSRDTTLGEAKRYAVLNDVFDLFRKLTGLE